ncbi:hypothetical protein pah_c050o001 [Parachlamydia acanthamoebae str. Hall's coccus]|nr:hypothetical protein pah_c050o001 [Parachlamydia acanthamoebae str. Hall's coccus]
MNKTGVTLKLKIVTNIFSIFSKFIYLTMNFIHANQSNRELFL